MTDNNIHFEGFKKKGDINDIDFNKGKKKSKFLGENADKFLLLLDLAKDIKNGKYKMSKGKIALLIATILYVISPIDAIPDFIPFIGWLDDIGIVSIALYQLADELTKYYHWKLGD